MAFSAVRSATLPFSVIVPTLTPPTVDPAGSAIEEPSADNVAVPNLMVDPLKNKSRNLYVALPRS